MGMLNYKQLARKVAKKTGYHVGEVQYIVKATFAVMLEELLNDNEIMITNFGKFQLSKRAPRKCIDARTGLPTMTNYKADIKFTTALRLGEKLALLTDPKYDWGDDNSVGDE